MKSVMIVFMSLCIALLASTALAQPFIEIEIEAGKEDGARVTIAHARVVFDAGAGINTVGKFDLIDAEFRVHTRHSAIFAGSADPVLNEVHYTFNDMNSPNIVLFETASKVLQIELETEFTRFYFFIVGTRPGLDPSVMTLSGIPEDYLINADAISAGLQVKLDGFGSPIDINEFGSMGFVLSRDGSIEYRVRVVDDPRVEPCLADLNGDGSLNFLDVSMYLQLYGNGCD